MNISQMQHECSAPKEPFPPAFDNSRASMSCGELTECYGLGHKKLF